MRGDLGGLDLQNFPRRPHLCDILRFFSGESTRGMSTRDYNWGSSNNSSDESLNRATQRSLQRRTETEIEWVHGHGDVRCEAVTESVPAKEPVRGKSRAVFRGLRCGEGESVGVRFG